MKTQSIRRFSIRAMIVAAVSSAAVLLAVSADQANAADLHHRDADRGHHTQQDGSAKAAIWQGFYLGAHGAFAGADMAAAGRNAFELEGFGGGVHAGYRVMRDRFVFGIEATATGHGATYDTTAHFGGQSITATLGMDATYSLKATAGITLGPVLLYASGGLAMGNATFDAVVTEHGRTTSISAEANATGFVIGGGIETRLRHNITARLEAHHYNFGDMTVAGAASPVKLDAGVVRAGLTWNFR